MRGAWAVSMGLPQNPKGSAFKPNGPWRPLAGAHSPSSRVCLPESARLGLRTGSSPGPLGLRTSRTPRPLLSSLSGFGVWCTRRRPPRSLRRCCAGWQGCPLACRVGSETLGVRQVKGAGRGPASLLRGRLGGSWGRSSPKAGSLPRVRNPHVQPRLPPLTGLCRLFPQRHRCRAEFLDTNKKKALGPPLCSPHSGLFRWWGPRPCHHCPAAISSAAGGVPVGGDPGGGDQNPLHRVSWVPLRPPGRWLQNGGTLVPSYLGDLVGGEGGALSGSVILPHPGWMDPCAPSSPGRKQ